jgi:GDPmannose 4,6-dehydratase
LKRALITGVGGQDGIHLAQFLLKKDYEVFGLIRGQRKNVEIDLKKRFPTINLIHGDLTDSASLVNALKISNPTEVYNLGAVSFVGTSFNQPELTSNVTGLGPLRLLEAIRSLRLENQIRFYQASSSEMFGKVLQTPQTELTPFYPRSPYGVAKVFAHHICVNYRDAYKMHISCGILFNHEGENRGHEFVTRKITSNLARIKLGLQERFSLGSLEPKRDWGYAGDFVEAMWLMVNQDKSDSFVIATGQTHSIRDFVLRSMRFLDLGDDIEKYVDFDKKMIRPAEVDLLVGDASKAKKILGWQSKTNLDDLIRIMLENDLRIESDKNI